MTVTSEDREQEEAERPASPPPTRQHEMATRVKMTLENKLCGCLATSDP